MCVYIIYANTLKNMNSIYVHFKQHNGIKFKIKEKENKKVTLRGRMKCIGTQSYNS